MESGSVMNSKLMLGSRLSCDFSVMVISLNRSILCNQLDVRKISVETSESFQTQTCNDVKCSAYVELFSRVFQANP